MFSVTNSLRTSLKCTFIFRLSGLPQAPTGWPVSRTPRHPTSRHPVSLSLGVEKWPCQQREGHRCRESPSNSQNHPRLLLSQAATHVRSQAHHFSHGSSQRGEAARMPQASLLTAGHSLFNPRRGWDTTHPQQSHHSGDDLHGWGILLSNWLQAISTWALGLSDQTTQASGPRGKLAVPAQMHCNRMNPLTPASEDARSEHGDALLHVRNKCALGHTQT